MSAKQRSAVSLAVLVVLAAFVLAGNVQVGRRVAAGGVVAGSGFWRCPRHNCAIANRADGTEA